MIDYAKFSIGDAFRFGWRLWKEHWPLLLSAVVISFLLPALPQFLQWALPTDTGFAYFALQVVHFILFVIAQMGIINITLRVAQGLPTSINDFFSTVHLFPSYLWGWILFYLAFFFGLLLFIVPGIIFALKFCLWPYYVLDRNFGGVDSLKASNRAVYGSKWDLLLFGLGTFLLNLLGLLLFGVGLLVTVPVTLLAWAYVYLHLSPQVEERETNQNV